MKGLTFFEGVLSPAGSQGHCKSKFTECHLPIPAESKSTYRTDTYTNPPKALHGLWLETGCSNRGAKGRRHLSWFFLAVGLRFQQTINPHGFSPFTEPEKDPKQLLICTKDNWLVYRLLRPVARLQGDTKWAVMLVLRFELFMFHGLEVFHATSRLRSQVKPFIRPQNLGFGVPYFNNFFLKEPL